MKCNTFIYSLLKFSFTESKKTIPIITPEAEIDNLEHKFDQKSWLKPSENKIGAPPKAKIDQAEHKFDQKSCLKPSSEDEISESLRYIFLQR